MSYPYPDIDPDLQREIDSSVNEARRTIGTDMSMQKGTMNKAIDFAGVSLGVSLTSFALFVVWIVLIVYTAKNSKATGSGKTWYISGACLAGAGYFAAAVMATVAFVQTAKGVADSAVDADGDVNKVKFPATWSWISIAFNLVLAGVMVFVTVKLANLLKTAKAA